MASRLAEAPARARTGAEEVPGARWRRFAVPSLADVVFLAVFVFAVRLGSVLTHRDGDLGRHLRLGGSILDGAGIPTVDVYSHTMAGGQMIPHEWLAQLSFAWVYRLLGFDGIGVLVAVVAALPWAVLFRYLVRRGTRITVAFPLVLLGAAASVVHWAARPHVFTWLFITAWVILLEDHRRGRRAHLWWLVPLMTLWANTHGAFISGFVLLAIYLVGARWESRRSGNRAKVAHLGLVLVGVVAASLVNPCGLTTIVNGFSYLREDFLLKFTNEYNSPDFHSLLFWPFLALLLLSVALSFRWKATPLLLMLGWATAALFSFRNIPLFAIIAMPILAPAVQEWFDDRPGRGERWPRWRTRLKEFDTVEKGLTGGALAALVVVVALLALGGSGDSRFAFQADYFPVEAMETLEGDLPGKRVFNQFEWGGYLLFCCAPEVRVFIDGQTDYYGTELTRQYDEALNAGPGWEEILTRYDVDWALVRPEEPLAQVLAESERWDEVYRDDVAVAYARRS
jgi:hypothetical protein